MNELPVDASEPSWAKPAVSIFSLMIFVVALLIAYTSKDSTSLTLMIGAAIAMGQQVVSYYLGSSSGSAKKTSLLATAPPVQTTTTTPTATTTTTTGTPVTKEATP